MTKQSNFPAELNANIIKDERAAKSAETEAKAIKAQTELITKELFKMKANRGNFVTVGFRVRAVLAEELREMGYTVVTENDYQSGHDYTNIRMK